MLFAHFNHLPADTFSAVFDLDYVRLCFFSPLNNDVNFILAFHGLMTAFTVSSVVVGKAFVEIHKPRGSS